MVPANEEQGDEHGPSPKSTSSTLRKLPHTLGISYGIRGKDTVNNPGNDFVFDEILKMANSQAHSVRCNRRFGACAGAASTSPEHDGIDDKRHYFATPPDFGNPMHPPTYLWIAHIFGQAKKCLIVETRWHQAFPPIFPELFF